jgi:hypothetical protein
MTNLSSKTIRIAFLGLSLAGIVNANANAMESHSDTVAGLPFTQIMAIGAAVGSVLGACYYVSLEQKDPSKVVLSPDASLVDKVILEFRKLCGMVSKKTETLNDEPIKEEWSEATGIGKVFSYYDAKEKNIKKALGFAAIVSGLIAGSLKLSFALAEFIKSAPGSEVVAKVVTETVKKADYPPSF